MDLNLNENEHLIPFSIKEEFQEVEHSQNLPENNFEQKLENEKLAETIFNQVKHFNEIQRKFSAQINAQLQGQSHIYDVLPCSACDKTFETEEALNLHVAERHCNTWIRGKWRRQNKLTYDCPYCNRVYSTQSHLTRHISEIHEKKKEDQAELKCHLCDFKTEKRYRLTDHLKLHEIERFDCDRCHESFSKKTALTRHKMAFHEKHKCQVRGCSFSCHEKMYGNMFNDAHVWKKSDKDYYLYKDDNKWVFFDELTGGKADFLTTEEVNCPNEAKVWKYYEGSTNSWENMTDFNVEIFEQIDYCSRDNPCDSVFETCENTVTEAICSWKTDSCPSGVETLSMDECFKSLYPQKLELSGVPEPFANLTIMGTYNYRNIKNKRPAFQSTSIDFIWLVYDRSGRWTLSEMKPVRDDRANFEDSWNVLLSQKSGDINPSHHMITYSGTQIF